MPDSTYLGVGQKLLTPTTGSHRRGRFPRRFYSYVLAPTSARQCKGSIQIDVRPMCKLRELLEEMEGRYIDEVMARAATRPRSAAATGTRSVARLISAQPG